MVEALDAHKKVVEVHKDGFYAARGQGARSFIIKQFDHNSGSNGTVKFWLRKDTEGGSAPDGTWFILQGTNSGKIVLVSQINQFIEKDLILSKFIQS